jgi:hypothetical protein
VLQWMTDPCDAELAAASCRLIRAFPIALMASLRIDHNLKSGTSLGGMDWVWVLIYFPDLPAHSCPACKARSV